MGYFVGCESESVYRIWDPDKNNVFRVSVARVDDGEGLDDPQDEPSRAIRGPTLDNENRNINTNSESGTTTSKTSDADDTSDSGNTADNLDNLVQEKPGIQGEDAFMSGALQPETDSEDGHNVNTDVASPQRNIDNVATEPSDNARTEGPEPNTSDLGPGQNTSDMDSSSSSGEESPYFQKPNPRIQMAKRKSESTATTESKKTETANNPKNVKVVSRGATTVTVFPLSTRNAQLAKRTNADVIPREPAKRIEQPNEQKCQSCAQDGKICDGVPPFKNTKCTACQGRGSFCVPQGNASEAVEKGQGQSMRQKAAINVMENNHVATAKAKKQTLHL